MDYKKNGLDFVRYYAAISIVILHFTSYYLIWISGHDGYVAPSLTERIARLGRNASLTAPGLVILFSLSGFLSMAASHDKTFLPKRFKRIFPLLWITTILCLISLVIVVPDYLDNSIIKWSILQIFGVAYTPSCLKSYATGSVNGTLWTIWVQLQLYVIIHLFFPILKKLDIRIWSVILILSAICNVLCQYLVTGPFAGYGIVSKLIERSFIPYFMWFFAGAMIFQFMDPLICWCKRLWPVFVIILILLRLQIIPDYGYYCGIITGLLTVITSFGIGYSLPSIRLYDITYEIFLVHWPILNIILHLKLLDKANGLLIFGLLIVASVAVSLLSKHILKVINICLSKIDLR